MGKAGGIRLLGKKTAAASAKVYNKPEIFGFFAERLDFISWVCYE